MCAVNKYISKINIDRFICLGVFCAPDDRQIYRFYPLTHTSCKYGTTTFKTNASLLLFFSPKNIIHIHIPRVSLSHQFLFAHNIKYRQTIICSSRFSRNDLASSSKSSTASVYQQTGLITHIHV